MTIFQDHCGTSFCADVVYYFAYDVSVYWSYQTVPYFVSTIFKQADSQHYVLILPLAGCRVYINENAYRLYYVL